MPDDMDRVQEANVNHVADALQRHAAMRARALPGLTHCEMLDCGEPIESKRTACGARLCEDCQRDEDIRAGQFARGHV